MVPRRPDEHLRLVLEPAKGLGVDDTIAVPLELRTHRAGLFVPLTPGTKPGPGRERRQPLLPVFEAVTNGYCYQ